MRRLLAALKTAVHFAAVTLAMAIFFLVTAGSLMVCVMGIEPSLFQGETLAHYQVLYFAIIAGAPVAGGVFGFGLCFVERAARARKVAP